jgi:hypothetical protein
VFVLYTSQEFIHNHSVQLSVEMPVERGVTKDLRLTLTAE